MSELKRIELKRIEIKNENYNDDILDDLANLGVSISKRAASESMAKFILEGGPMESLKFSDEEMNIIIGNVIKDFIKCDDLARIKRMLSIAMFSINANME